MLVGIATGSIVLLDSLIAQRLEKLFSGAGTAAVAAVKQFGFAPAEIAGKPAAVEISYRYEFVLKRAPPPPPR